MTTRAGILLVGAGALALAVRLLRRRYVARSSKHLEVGRSLKLVVLFSGKRKSGKVGAPGATIRG